MTTQLREPEDLPILDEIGRDLSAAFAREDQLAERRRRGRRLRRIAAATAALFVIGPGSVVATRYIWAPDPGVNAPGTPFEGSKPVQIADGQVESVSWRISAYVGDRGLCWQTAVFTADKSFGRAVSCLADLKNGRMAQASLSGGGEVVHVGWAPPATARVMVVDGAGRRLPARVVTAPADRVQAAKLPRDLKFYVAAGPLEAGALPGLRGVVALDAAGREIERFPPPPSR